MSALIEFDAVCKYYQMGDTTVKAADHISMEIQQGEFVAIVGQSGSGKSTCMNIIGCLDVPTDGTYRLDGRDVGKMSRNELAAIRNEKLGFIFQQYNLLPKLNLLENVEVPLIYAGVPRAERHALAKAALEQVGLGDKLKNKPSQLSGGQQQRVSIARALVRNPPVILADEPTGALDSHTGREVSAMLQQLHQQGHTVVLITHDNSIAVQAERIIRLEDGQIVYDGDSHSPDAVVQSTFAADRRTRHDPGDLPPGSCKTSGAINCVAFLTMLGIIIGVMAVIVIVGLGNGMTGKMKPSFTELGTNTITVNVWSQGARSVSVDEMHRLIEANTRVFPLENTSPHLLQQHRCR